LEANLSSKGTELEKFDGFYKPMRAFETLRYIPDEVENDLRLLLACEGGSGASTVGTDFVVYERLFSESFLMGLYEDMQWLEKHYYNDFIKTKVEKGSGTVKGDLSTYHRVSNVYWLIFVRKDDLQHMPNLVKFNDWLNLLRA
jgi:hypothetical protein